MCLSVFGLPVRCVVWGQEKTDRHIRHIVLKSVLCVMTERETSVKWCFPAVGSEVILDIYFDAIKASDFSAVLVWDVV